MFMPILQNMRPANIAHPFEHTSSVPFEGVQMLIEWAKEAAQVDTVEHRLLEACET